VGGNSEISHAIKNYLWRPEFYVPVKLQFYKLIHKNAKNGCLLIQMQITSPLPRLQDKKSRAFHESFLFVLLVSWLPLKVLSYATPFVVVGWIIIRASSGRTLIRSIAIMVAYCIICAFYSIIGEVFRHDVVLHNMFFSAITYGSFFYLWAVPGSWSYSREFYFRICKSLKTFVLIEGLVGIGQFFLSAAVNGFGNSTGDSVQGTIYLFAFREKVDMGLGNQIFAINMSMMLLFLLPSRNGKFAVLIGGFALLLSGVTHVIIPFVFAIAFAFLVMRRMSVKMGYKGIGLLILVTTLGLLIVKSQFELIEYYAHNFAELDSPKVRATAISLTDLPQKYPAVPYTGVGPGQYTSRASLIGTGFYIGGSGRTIFGLKPGMSRPFQEYILPEYLEYATNPRYGFSTMSRPFDSVLSIATEFGWIIFALLNVIVFWNVSTLRRRYFENRKNNDMLASNIAVACVAGIFFLLMISFFENYLEVPQAVFPGLMLMKMAINSDVFALNEKLAP
jgi:hypothetical protein